MPICCCRTAAYIRFLPPLHPSGTVLIVFRILLLRREGSNFLPSNSLFFFNWYHADSSTFTRCLRTHEGALGAERQSLHSWIRQLHWKIICALATLELILQDFFGIHSLHSQAIFQIKDRLFLECIQSHLTGHYKTVQRTSWYQFCYAGGRNWQTG